MARVNVKESQLKEYMLKFSTMLLPECRVAFVLNEYSFGRKRPDLYLGLRSITNRERLFCAVEVKTETDTLDIKQIKAYAKKSDYVFVVLADTPRHRRAIGDLPEYVGYAFINDDDICTYRSPERITHKSLYYFPKPRNMFLTPAARKLYSENTRREFLFYSLRWYGHVFDKSSPSKTSMDALKQSEFKKLNDLFHHNRLKCRRLTNKFLKRLKKYTKFLTFS
ncbi:MAG: hypothetical protein ACRC9L_01040 [Brevinema sp.]